MLLKRKNQKQKNKKPKAPLTKENKDKDKDKEQNPKEGWWVRPRLKPSVKRVLNILTVLPFSFTHLL
jgi:hypothetical protein